MPPNGTAGLARSAVSGHSRLPSPPARTMPRTPRCATCEPYGVLGGFAALGLRGHLGSEPCNEDLYEPGHISGGDPRGRHASVVVPGAEDDTAHLMVPRHPQPATPVARVCE